MSKKREKQTAVIVIPTFNEANIIVNVIDHLFQHIVPNIKQWEWKVIVVNRHSTDNTEAAVKSRQKKHPNLHLIFETEKESIGAAYLRGFKEATSKHHPDIIIELDSGSQHSTETISSLLERIERGADCVLGYKTKLLQAGWSLKRRSPSRMLRFLIRLILFFPTKTYFRVTDPMTGFRAYRVENFIELFEEPFRYSSSIGYRLESLYRMVKIGARIMEVPIDPHLKQTPVLTHNAQILGGTVKTAFLLRLHDPATKRFLKFAVVGFTGYVINAVALEAFRNTQFTYSIAQYFSQSPKLSQIAILENQSAWSAGLAAEIAIISNYLFNNFWTFSTHRIRAPFKFIVKLLQFNLTSFGAIMIQFFVIGFATMIFKDTPAVREGALIFAVVVLIIPYNWTIYNWLIWKVKRLKSSSD
jgi:glycosyltransferase involved in cell wall biosynthesis